VAECDWSQVDGAPTLHRIGDMWEASCGGVGSGAFADPAEAVVDLGKRIAATGQWRAQLEAHLASLRFAPDYVCVPWPMFRHFIGEPSEHNFRGTFVCSGGLKVELRCDSRITNPVACQEIPL
jgi:hypothetical protein